MKKISGIFLVILILVGGLVFIYQRNSYEHIPQAEKEVGTLELMAENLHVPWTIAFLPDGMMLATERNGNLRIGTSSRIISVEGVVERGEGGLMGLAVHPNYSNNKYIYLYFTTQTGGKITNKVVRYVFDGTTLSENKVIVDAIPGGSNHNGGRIAFGPDGMLYITTGEIGNENLAQDKASLAGKILRVHDDGSIPADNPFGTAVYSYGHRNPQGLAWDSFGNLWSTEHGRSGLQSGFDEVNLIKKGANYGWPRIQGGETREGMEAPILHSGPTTTWAPAAIVYANNKLYFAGLRGQALFEVAVTGNGTLGNISTRYKEEFGRLRAVARDMDGNIYFGTSNQDGRGSVQEGDDKIIKLVQ